MSKISRRKFVTAGLATTAGVSGLAVAAKLAKRYGLVPPGQRWHLWAGRNPDLCRSTASHQALVSPRISSQHDFEGSFANNIAPLTMPSNVSRPADLRTGAFHRWHGRAARHRFRCPTSRVSGPQPDHRSSVRGGMVLYRRVDRNALFEVLKAAGVCRRPDISCISRSIPTGGRASTWPMLCIPRLC